MLSMAQEPSVVRDVSDTALWAAAFRAQENDRDGGLFHDPFAARLAGPRGFEIANALSTESHSISWITRTFLFDRLIAAEIARGVDVVVNLGAGLDSRPYRMRLPQLLLWLEVDAPGIIAYKEHLLAEEKPSCKIERIGLDLRDAKSRRTLLAEFAKKGRNILVVTEGLLIYLETDDVAGLASELAAENAFGSWILELASPHVLDTMQRTAGDSLGKAGASFKFAPPEGPSFFEPYGWNLVQTQSVLKTAVELGRTPIDPKLALLIPNLPLEGPNSMPWIGVCQFRRQQQAARTLGRQSDIPHLESCG
jgi:methyltransferase (TIGR00027 family)